MLTIENGYIVNNQLAGRSIDKYGIVSPCYHKTKYKVNKEGLLEELTTN